MKKFKFRFFKKQIEIKVNYYIKSTSTFVISAEISLRIITLKLSNDFDSNVNLNELN